MGGGPLGGPAIRAPAWRQLTRGTFRDFQCRLDPSGEAVAFVRALNTGGVRVASLANGEESEITGAESDNGWPAWSCDGSRLAYVERGTGVWIHHLETGEREQVAAEFDASRLLWIPGDRLFFQRAADRERNYTILDLDARTESKLLPSAEGGTLFQACASPDGGALAVAGNRGFGDNVRVWLIDFADGSERLLHAGWAAPFAWSPDGRWVYLITGEDAFGGADRSDVLRVAADGGPVEHLFECPGVVVSWENISMSADGRRIVCAVNERASDVWLVEGLAL